MVRRGEGVILQQQTHGTGIIAILPAMLRSAGFRVEQHPEREVYLCRRDTRPWGVEAPPC